MLMNMLQMQNKLLEENEVISIRTSNWLKGIYPEYYRGYKPIGLFEVFDDCGSLIVSGMAYKPEKGGTVLYDVNC